MSGLPVVSSTSALITDQLVAAGAALACPPDAPEVLADHLARLMADDATVEAMSRRGHASAGGMAPSETAWGALLIELYRDILARPGARPAAAGAGPAWLARAGAGTPVR
jgi:glycosyltransferase involved in cell wall biosynthesis